MHNKFSFGLGIQKDICKLGYKLKTKKYGYIKCIFP